MTTEWTFEEEAKRLKQRFAEAKANGIGQAQFARENAVPGGASMVNQHINGHRPISLEAGWCYARGFGCTLAEISPRLASAVGQSADMTIKRQSDPPADTAGEASATAMEIALLYDLIPATDRIRRTRAYNSATAAILAVLEEPQATYQDKSDSKK